MRGLELSKFYYENIGKKALEKQFPELMLRMAVGLAGEGSECFGFDDILSSDHDWGPSFCIWLSEEDYIRYGKQVQAMYSRLPGSAAGYPPRKNSGALSSGRIGCLCAEHWYRRYTGYAEGPETLEQWRHVPEAFLATATNGEIFHDPMGKFSAVREKLQRFYPEDIRIKKIVARAAVMAQAGQYNYPRCVKRQEHVAAQLALAEFSRAAMSMVYLLNRKYAPFYKWMHHGMRYMEKLPRVGVQLDMLVQAEPKEAEERIEGICTNVAAELRRQGLTTKEDTFLLELCPDMMERIRDEKLHKTHFMQE
ncbi:MAG: DUF4037 domain-containing protein [Clostridia bacterium]|nr:DUF4037 domain-containing protein [Clostridia bacterium]